MKTHFLFCLTIIISLAGCTQHKCTYNGVTYDTCYYSTHNGSFAEYYIKNGDTLIHESLPVPPSPPEEPRVTDIIDWRSKNEPLPTTWDRENLEGHQYHDVAVYRTSLNGNYYEVLFYRNEQDTLTGYKASWATDEDLDKAEYGWENDTLLHMRLFNSVTKNELTFKLWGHGNSTGVIER
jgi:hypothetical protein